MKRLFLASLVSFLTFGLQAEQIYIEVDQACMEKLVYKVKTFTGSKLLVTGKTISYSVRPNVDEQILLNIGEESEELFKKLPNNTKSCSDITFNENFVQKINSLNTQVFLVTKLGKKFRMTPVQTAEYFYSSDEEMAYAAKDFGFNYNFTLNDPKSNLLTFGVKSKVNFNFRDDKSCPSEYHFRKQSRKRNHQDYGMVFVSDLGMIKKNVINRKTKKLVKQFELESINKVDVLTYMDLMCGVGEEIEVVDTQVKKKEIKTPAKEKSKVAVVTKDKFSKLKKKPQKEIVVKAAAKEKEEMLCPNIYKDLDRGFYYDRTTGLPAEGDCGGLTYNRGVIDRTFFDKNDRESNYLLTTIGEPKVKEEEVIEPVVRVEKKIAKPIVKESEPIIVYKEPKIIYREADPILITKTVDQQKAVIPANTQNHVVAKGETLYRLSKKYNVSIEDLRSWNNLGQSNLLSIGDEVVVNRPTKKESLPTNDFVSKGAAPIFVHQVQKGETLYAISKMHNTTVDILKEINSLQDDNIRPGMNLKLSLEQPVKKTAVKATKKVDTLKDLKKAEAIMPSQLKTSKPVKKTAAVPESKPIVAKPAKPVIEPIKQEKMDIKGGEITIDQPIVQKSAPEKAAPKSVKIPNPPYTIHIVDEKETLQDIAKKYNTSVEAIRKANEMEVGEVVIPFQRIRIQ